jgi:hypothetical protein
MIKSLYPFLIPAVASVFFLSCQKFPSTLKLYDLNTCLESRSISFENPTGAPGQGGRVASSLGVGRKGAAYKFIKSGETVVLCDIKGPGNIRHIWMTGLFKDNRMLLRSTVIRAYWENQPHPSIECPAGDFFGCAQATIKAYESAVHSVSIHAGFNIWLPMPFKERAKITLTNESSLEMILFYQIDYTTNDCHPVDFGRLHVLFRRENPTTLKKDFTIFPKRTGKGRYIGAVLGIRALGPHWWGEGELKIYMDGDREFPTICGTGSEDYVCLSHGMQQTPYRYHGCNYHDGEKGLISMYRWHLPDPVYWKKECRVTIQQMGANRGCFERQDDWSTATFWYEAIPSAPLPEFPSLEQRINDILEPVIKNKN